METKKIIGFKRNIIWVLPIIMFATIWITYPETYEFRNGMAIGFLFGMIFALLILIESKDNKVV